MPELTPSPPTTPLGLDAPLISADGHIDLPMLPADVFTSAAPASARATMPAVVDGDAGPQWVAADGTVLARVGGIGSSGRIHEPGQIQRADRMAETGLFDDAAAGRFRPSDADLRVGDQDRDGVAGEAVYGILSMLSKLAPADAVVAARAYNDYLASFCAAHPRRLAGIACLTGGPDDVAAELRRAASADLRGAELCLSHDMVPLWRDEWEPLWQAAGESGLPLHLHTIGPPIDIGWVDTPRQMRSWLGVFLTGFQLTVVDHLASLVFGGVLERHAGLQVVLGECGIGWLAYVLERMDLEWDEQFGDLGLTLAPSGYWRRQMHATFQIDRAGLELLDRIGPETVMWGNDYPHADGTWPDSRAILAQQLGAADVSAASRRLILHDNAARLYRLG